MATDLIVMEHTHNGATARDALWDKKVLTYLDAIVKKNN